MYVHISVSCILVDKSEVYNSYMNAYNNIYLSLHLTLSVTIKYFAIISMETALCVCVYTYASKEL